MKRNIIILMLALFAAGAVWGCGKNESGEIATEIPIGKEDAENPVEEAETEIPIGEMEPEETAEEDGPEVPSEEEVTEATEEGNGDPVGEMNVDYGALAGSVNSFNWKLYDGKGSGDNLFYSPYSIASAVALADLAAKGDTREAINEALGIADLDEFMKGVKAFNSKKQSETAYFKAANGIFIDSSLKLSPDYGMEFEDPAKEFFNGEFKIVDFKDTDSVNNEISSWVKEKTEDLIPDYRSNLDSSTVADILNAVYFYGEWQSKFHSQDTYKEEFHAKDKDYETDFMHKENGYFRLVSGKGGLKAVALPYMESTYEMDLIMPENEEIKELSDIFKEIKPEELLTELDKAEETELGMLMLPKFKMDLDYQDLKNTLSSLGMEKAFSDNADFSAIAEDMKITDIAHRAVIEVDEEGSRAAAVTEIMMGLTSLPAEEPVLEDFIADRPFIYMIRDRESGIILFMGRFSHP